MKLINLVSTSVDPVVAASGEFAKLPDEVLEMIVFAMDTQTKLNSSLTCKRFNEMVSSKTGLKKFVCTLDFDTNFIVGPGRKYQNIKIKNLTSPESQEREIDIIRLFQSIGDSVTSVTFSLCTVHEHWIAEVLRLLPKTSWLRFECTNIRPSPFFDPPALLELKTFKIESDLVHTAVRLIHRVETLQEVDLGLATEHDYDVGSLPEFLNTLHNFLQRQKDLKSLSISRGDFFNVPSNFSFALDKLVLFVSNLNSDQSFNLLRLLQGQNHIKSLTLNVKTASNLAVFNHGSRFHECIKNILEMKMLTKLKVVFYCTSSMGSYFRDCGIVNKNVKHLYLSLRPLNHSYKRFIEAVVVMFPNVENLELKLDGEWLDSQNTGPTTFEPLNMLSKLSKLQIEDSTTRLITSLKIPNLKHFSMLDIESSVENDWEIFFSNNPNIKNLRANFWSGVPKQSAVRLIELAVLNCRQAVKIKVCLEGHSPPLFTLKYLEVFASQSRSENLRYLRICKSNFHF